MLDVRRLRLLRELHARGTIAAVADAMHFTPSAVSQQLTALEREAGVPLLERVGRNVRLTDAALRLVEHADAVLERLELAEAELGSGAEVRGSVRVAAFQTAAYWMVAPAIVRLAESHPGIEVALDELEPEDSLPLLRVGDVDMVIAEEYEYAPRRRDPALERHPLADDAIVLVLPERHRLARRRSVPLDALADEPWAATREDTRWAEMVVRTCRSLGGFEPRISYRASDIRLYCHLAAAGLAVALVPSLGRPETEPGVAVRPVAGADLKRSVFATTRRGAAERPAVAAVLETLRGVGRGGRVSAVRAAGP
jgi:DNA-binding transcriptional LysR family regulator